MCTGKEVMPRGVFGDRWLCCDRAGLSLTAPDGTKQEK